MNPSKFLALGVAVVSLIAGNAFAQSIAGEYKCEGKGPDGSAYSGNVFIKKLSDPIYTMKWDLGGGSDYVGTGVFESGILAAAYGGGKPYGLVVYQVKGGTLKGKWLIGGQSAVGEENLEGPEGLNGIYKITSAKNAEGKAYSGKVAITKNGETYSVNWTLPSESYSGVGTLVADTLVVGWGQGTGFGTVIYVQEGSTLKGKWASANDDTLGSETLTKK
jgi:hypothetical protein